MPCWRLQGQQPGLTSFDVIQCWATIRVGTGAAGSHGGTLYYYTRTTVDGAETPSGDCSVATFSRVADGTCGNCADTGQYYDCINGSCIGKETYNTPGLYASLPACQSMCGAPITPPCDGECVSNAQIAALQQAANIITSKLCG